VDSFNCIISLGKSGIPGPKPNPGASPSIQCSLIPYSQFTIRWLNANGPPTDNGYHAVETHIILKKQRETLRSVPHVKNWAKGARGKAQLQSSLTFAYNGWNLVTCSLNPHCLNFLVKRILLIRRITLLLAKFKFFYLRFVFFLAKI
jgi:hypothetical protein